MGNWSLAFPALFTSAAISSTFALSRGSLGSLTPSVCDRSVGPMATRSMPLSPAICSTCSMALSSSAITDSTIGDADFYYYRTRPDASGDVLGDWLYFVIEDDIRRDDDGDLVRDYDYEHVGFFSDAALGDKVSDLTQIEGDDVHEKVRIEPGDVLYIEDDQKRVYRIDVGEKPSTYKIELDVTRVK